MKNLLVIGFMIVISKAIGAQEYNLTHGETANFRSSVEISETEEARIERSYNVLLNLDRTRRNGIIRAVRESDSFFRILSEDLLSRAIEIRKPRLNERVRVPTLYNSEPYYIGNYGKKPTSIPWGNLFYDGRANIHGYDLPSVRIRGNELDLQGTEAYMEMKFDNLILDYSYVTLISGKVNSILDSLNRHRDPALVVKTIDGGVHLFNLSGESVFDSYYSSVIEDTVAIK